MFFKHTLLILCDRLQAFDDWNKTELDSFLIEITANILKFRDTDNAHLLPKIRDSAGQKGTGKWTAISALEYGTPVTLIGKTRKCRVSSFVTMTLQKSLRHTWEDFHMLSTNERPVGWDRRFILAGSSVGVFDRT